eukprot:m.96579 g.96579  ORF g.96579 m.96579 type:complete len:227 (+) comp26907_c0_seq2:465-1145(+)
MSSFIKDLIKTLATRYKFATVAVTGTAAVMLYPKVSPWFLDPPVDLDPDDDPFDLRERFIRTHERHFDEALDEIKRGCKQSHWSWYIWPTPPWVGKPFGDFIGEIELSRSPTNRYYALRDPAPDNHRGEKAAAAYLAFENSSASGDVDTVTNLRANYITIMNAVADQLESGIDAYDLAGPADVPKLIGSLRLFEQVSRNGHDDEVNRTCIRTLVALGVSVEKPNSD